MATRFDIQNGMTVRSSDGEKLGKIVSFDANSFIVEKGFFFPKEYEISSADISDIRGDEVYLRHTKDMLLSGSDWNKADTSLTDRVIGNEHHTAGTSATLRAGEEVRVPLAEEELNVRKESQQAGVVRIRKDVVTEQKTVTVPVTREVVRVERVPVSGEAHASAVGSMFKEETIEVPLREERAIFDKDVVVREELRVTKDSVQEQATATETLRRETADVREEGDIVRHEGVIDQSSAGYAQDRLDYNQSGSTLDQGRFEQTQPGIGSNLDDPLKRKL